MLTDDEKERAAALALRIPRQVVPDVLEWMVVSGISLDALRGPCRETALVDARQDVAVMLRDRGLSLPQIGRVINRHHASVLNLLERAERQRRAGNDSQKDAA